MNLTVIAHGKKTVGTILTDPGTPATSNAYDSDGRNIQATITDTGDGYLLVVYPGDRPADGARVHGWQDAAQMVYGPGAVAEDIVARVAACEVPYRLGSAVGHVAGFGTLSHGALVKLVSQLRDDPGRAELSAVFHGGFSGAATTRQVVIVSALIDMLGQVEHDAPPELAGALVRYRDTLRQRIADA